MEAEKIIINANQPETMVVLRKDATPQLIEKAPLVLNGTIGSVIDFYEKRTSIIQPENSHVTIDIKAGIVKLEVDDSLTVKTATVVGKLVEHPWIAALGINKEVTWEPKVLLNKVRLSRMLFETATEHVKMAESLANITGKIAIEFSTSDDFKGNTEQRKLTSLTSSIPTTFEFYFQPYVGMDKEVIQVETQVLTEGGAVKIQLVSPKLAEVLDAEKERQIHETMETLSALPIILC